MAFPQVQNVGSDGVVIGAGGTVPVSGTVSVATTSGAGATQATTNLAVPANASNVTVKTGAGRIFTVTVTTVGSITGMTFTDNSVVIASLSAAQVAAIGTTTFNVPFFTNLVVVGGATNASVTISFA